MTPLSAIFSHNPFARLLGSNDGQVYYVVHPLDDVPEQKCDPATLGPLKLSRGERFVLIGLQGYLVVMVGLAIYRMVDLASTAGSHMIH